MLVSWLGILGLCMGSFASALVWRLHAKRNFITERSECEHCGHVLAWYDLLPIVSWLLLKGTCRYCHKKLSIEYPLTEFLTGCLFVLLYTAWPNQLAGWEYVRVGLWLVIATGFVVLTLFDMKWMLLPNKIVLPMLTFALAERAAYALLYNDVNVVRETVLGIVFGGGIFWLLFEVSRGKWIGGGDVKLGFLVGALVGGPLSALLVLFIASWLGASYGLVMMGARKLRRTSHIPFGPFLMSAAVIVFLYGRQLIDLYSRLFL